MPNEPLDSETHSGYLADIQSCLEDILKEIKALRKDVQELTREVAGLDRG